jgi:hypothetical protein
MKFASALGPWQASWPGMGERSGDGHFSRWLTQSPPILVRGGCRGGENGAKQRITIAYVSIRCNTFCRAVVIDRKRTKGVKGWLAPWAVANRMKR